MEEKTFLLPDERVVAALSRVFFSLTLTNKRVRYDNRRWFDSATISMTLESIASCGLNTNSSPWILFIGAIALVVAFFVSGDIQTASFVIAGGSIVCYLLERRAVIVISSAGGDKITAPIKGLGRKEVLDFLNAVECEKLRRLEAVDAGTDSAAIKA